MRRLFILRGVAGSGKSTLVKELGLEDYTISSDEVRKLYNGLSMTETGDMGIPQYNAKAVFRTIREMMEERMKKGSFIVYDATNIKLKDIRPYRNLAKQYSYRIHVVEFNLDLVEIKRRNLTRPVEKRVPENVIERQFLAMKDNNLPSWANKIDSSELKDYIMFNSVDLSNYKRIHHIGDIHSSYEPLKEYFTNGLKDDEFYIFVGDYLDRGFQAKEVMEFMLDIYDRQNVICLKGNHEKYLERYIKDEPLRSATATKSIQDIEYISKTFIRSFTKSLVDGFIYEYKGKKVLVTHAGLQSFPKNLNLINSEHMLTGIGGYDIDIDHIFTKNHKEDNLYQVHGHRNMNVDDIDIMQHKKSFNLNDTVEFGGFLRVLTLDDLGFKPHYIKNNVAEPLLIKEMLKNENITIKDFGHISSLNFNREVFSKRLWDKQTIKARGLFINNNDLSIAARAYDKFFNIEEGKFNTMDKLRRLNYPVTAYEKENGFLGILGYDKVDDKLLVCSKSSLVGEHAKYFEDILLDLLDEEELKDLKNYLKTENVSLTFEVIDPVNDPHIIKYDKKELYLLDIIKREYKYISKPFQEVKRIANKYGFKHKKYYRTFTNSHELISFIENNKYNMDFKIDNKETEGLVFTDRNGYSFKFKSLYYSFWKTVRIILGDFDNLSDRLEKIRRFKELKDITYLDRSEEEQTEFLKLSEITGIKQGIFLNSNIDYFKKRDIQDKFLDIYKLLSEIEDRENLSIVDVKDLYLKKLFETN